MHNCRARSAGDCAGARRPEQEKPIHVQNEAFRKAEAEREAWPEAVASGRPTPAEAESSAKDPEERIAELTRALAATREREADFRQAAFDLNAELLRKDAEIESYRERLEAADAQVAELADIRNHASELEGLMQTRAFRAATWWWRVKAVIRPR
jgi:chromosome segregation ATPase